jgi:drug/metabolite transporter (DMT)-like permease
MLGTNVGILLQQVVLKQLPLGIGITVLSTAPVMALLVAAPEGDHPRAAGFFASFLAVTGIALAVLA